MTSSDASSSPPEPGKTGKRISSPGKILAEQIPVEFKRRMEDLLGDEYASFMNIYTQPAAAGLRVNPLKISVEEFLSLVPFKLEELSWSDQGFRFLDPDPLPQPGKHPYHAAGLYYLQDPSAMAVVELLDPQPGEKVLDLSAAPGGKATHIITRMQNQGLLVANEMHPRRAWDLAENLERFGAHNTAILNDDPRKLADHFGAFFDRVLVDAPCSGEGMFRKSQAARAAWSPYLVQSCAVRQLNILNEAAKMVRTGGRLVYSTCTFAPEEDEILIARFLEQKAPYATPTFKVIQVPIRTGFSSGMPEWVGNPGFAAQAAQIRHTVRLFPHRGAPEGHFIAVLQRTDDGPQPGFRPFKPKISPEVRNIFRQFLATNLEESLFPQVLAELTLEGTYLYARSSLLPSLGKLKTLHPGWWLGQLKANRFEPSHALAMGLMSDQALHSAGLHLEEPALTAYLRGESLPLAGENGWVLATIEAPGIKKAFPIGWGKRSGGMLKNFYPRGLRWS